MKNRVQNRLKIWLNVGVVSDGFLVDFGGDPGTLDFQKMGFVV